MVARRLVGRRTAALRRLLAATHNPPPPRSGRGIHVGRPSVGASSLHPRERLPAVRDDLDALAFLEQAPQRREELSVVGGHDNERCIPRRRATLGAFSERRSSSSRETALRLARSGESNSSMLSNQLPSRLSTRSHAHRFRLPGSSRTLGSRAVTRSASGADGGSCCPLIVPSSGAEWRRCSGTVRRIRAAVKAGQGGAR
jgi:hypothetical protein